MKGITLGITLVERSGTEWNGVERSGAEWSGVERSGVERSGAERSGAERSGADWTGKALDTVHYARDVNSVFIPCVKNVDNIILLRPDMCIKRGRYSHSNSTF